ncbi:hypothetical protein EVAR_37663_1 [Eumeta japonica]|uniref:Uncharacterized protein n=1 Tax=Eumeta variegata TaxID=151549 RepID=A0A4C1Z135_EUMVA|nr:hypothetical protein EVAR_37663_1 [Eumeta japonica]
MTKRRSFESSYKLKLSSQYFHIKKFNRSKGAGHSECTKRVPRRSSLKNDISAGWFALKIGLQTRSAPPVTAACRARTHCRSCDEIASKYTPAEEQLTLKH